MAGPRCRSLRAPAGCGDSPDGTTAPQPGSSEGHGVKRAYTRWVADLPIVLDGPLAEQLARALDIEEKIPAALQALGPVAGRDVLLIDAPTALRRQLKTLGARTRHVGKLSSASRRAAESVDVVVGWWSSFRGVDAADIAAVDRLLRPGGRLLVVHDYGRDDVSRLRGDQPEYGSWSRRDGPFLSGGFRIRVLHCWWTFGSLEEAREFLAAAFGEDGVALGAELKRPRLSYKVAVYHRTRGGDDQAPSSTNGTDAQHTEQAGAGARTPSG